MSALAGAAAAAAAAWAATRCYDFLEGERLFADLADEIRLAHSRLEDLDRAWAAAPARSPIIVSLSTIPSRLPLLGGTLKSLLRQTRPPARIELNLPEFSRREQRAYEIPPFLQGLASLAILRTPDWGPATKFIPTAQRHAAAQPIVVVDDDRIYPANLLADLEAASRAHPGCALGMSGWRVPADLTDRPSTLRANLFMEPPSPVRATRLREALEVDVLQGMSGYLVTPALFDLQRLADYRAAPPAAFFVDDVWISAHCRARKLVIPARRLNFPPKRHAAFFKSNSVALVNRGDGSPESRNNTIVIRHLREAWLCSRPAGPAGP